MHMSFGALQPRWIQEAFKADRAAMLKQMEHQHSALLFSGTQRTRLTDVSVLQMDTLAGCSNFVYANTKPKLTRKAEAHQ